MFSLTQAKSTAARPILIAELETEIDEAIADMALSGLPSAGHRDAAGGRSIACEGHAWTHGLRSIEPKLPRSRH